MITKCTTDQIIKKIFLNFRVFSIVFLDFIQNELKKLTVVFPHSRENIAKFENLSKIKFGLLLLQVMSKFQPISI
jgi:hypothetical protein